LQFIHLYCCNLCAYQKQTSEMEGETQSVTCEPNKEATRSPPRDITNIDIPDPVVVVPAGVSYPPPPLSFFDNVVIHIGLNLQFIDFWCCNLLYNMLQFSKSIRIWARMYLKLQAKMPSILMLLLTWA